SSNKNMEENTTDTTDWISMLPDCIVHRILSYLLDDLKSRVRMSVLSKEWLLRLLIRFFIEKGLQMMEVRLDYSRPSLRMRMFHTGVDMTKDSKDSSKKKISTTSTPQFYCPMQKPSNYSLWAIRMQIILEANGLWEMIELNRKTQADNKKDKTAIAFLYQALPKEKLLQITKHKTAKAIWDALKTRHVGEERVQQARLQTLKSDFKMLHMKEDETIDTFTGKLTTLEASLTKKNHEARMEGNSIELQIDREGVGSENLDGGVTKSMSRREIKEDIYATRNPIGRQSFGSIINQKYDKPRLKEDHNNEGGSNQKNMINLDLREITTMKVGVTTKYDQHGHNEDHGSIGGSNQKRIDLPGFKDVFNLLSQFVLISYSVPEQKFSDLNSLLKAEVSLDDIRKTTFIKEEGNGLVSGIAHLHTIKREHRPDLYELGQAILVYMSNYRERYIVSIVTWSSKGELLVLCNKPLRK
nr:zinc finger, CCHC-type [Tanacetum cinerariifolium]